MEKNQILEALPSFTGTIQYYRHSGNFIFTDGAAFIAKHCGGGAYWLLDLIISYQYHQTIAKEPFQVYRLKVNADKSALITIDDGDGKILAKQIIEYTDFPLDEITLWFVDNVILLPSEY